MVRFSNNNSNNNTPAPRFPTGRFAYRFGSTSLFRTVKNEEEDLEQSGAELFNDYDPGRWNLATYRGKVNNLNERRAFLFI